MVPFRRGEMSSVQNNGNGWFIDYGIGEDAQATDFIWASQIIDDPTSSVSLDVLCKEGNHPETSSKKRNRAESCAEPGTKACREKMRRDRLNDRFYELCSILEPGKPPRSDKVAILSDATRRLKQLRVEAQTFKESNETLQETIKNLKTEKVELRDEKVRLKAEKERMEQILKGLSAPSPFISHPAVSGAYHPAIIAAYNKTVPFPNYPPVTMWQWLPPAVLDTSQDHVLRPPVA